MTSPLDAAVQDRADVPVVTFPGIVETDAALIGQAYVVGTGVSVIAIQFLSFGTLAVLANLISVAGIPVRTGRAVSLRLGDATLVRLAPVEGTRIVVRANQRSPRLAQPASALFLPVA